MPKGCLGAVTRLRNNHTLANLRLARSQPYPNCPDLLPPGLLAAFRVVIDRQPNERSEDSYLPVSGRPLPGRVKA